MLLGWAATAAARADWLIDPRPFRAVVEAGADGEVSLSNGLVRRTFRLQPNAATVGLDQLVTGQSLLRSVRPEATITINGKGYDIGGLAGQVEHAYLRRDWLKTMTSPIGAFRCTGHETGRTQERMAWKRVRYAPATAWPPPGVSLTFKFEPPEGELRGVHVVVHYELYDGIPVMAKWLEVRNESGAPVTVDRFMAEIVAAVEAESQVEGSGVTGNPMIQVETDYSFVATHPTSTVNRVAEWVPDKLYTTQVNYRLDAPLLLEVKPPVGPGIEVRAGGVFESFRVFELLHDSTERERRGLAARRMYRVLAPWVTENPILMHVRRSEPEAVRLAIDQAAEVGFEMVILSFGSGFNMENEDAGYLEQVRGLVEYGRKKGIDVGGYSLLASRKISPEDDVINPKTGTTGGAIFENSPCLLSRWGDEYFRKLRHFIEATGVRVLEHDGSYPGDVCASTTHPGHRGLADSQWLQWRRITEFYQWARARGVYLNVPDWYFLEGSNKSAMGYREVNWSLPRERQFILARQNMFDGTWEKTPSMGWMFVPLVQYQGGGDAATLEPLREHLEAYEQHLAQNFGAGVQACYRGPRLFDSEETKAVVKRWVQFYKSHRAILDSDIIHVRRPDGRDIDVILHVNPQLPEKGLAVIHNPLDEAVTRTVRLPLYYTGLTETARIREQDGKPRTLRLSRGYEVEVPVTIAARGRTWLVIE